VRFTRGDARGGEVPEVPEDEPKGLVANITGEEGRRLFWNSCFGDKKVSADLGVLLLLAALFIFSSLLLLLSMTTFRLGRVLVGLSGFI
jgi:hypothetical protein